MEGLSLMQTALDHVRKVLYWAPQWLIEIVILALAAAFGLLLVRWVFRLLERLARHFGSFAIALVRRSAGPVAVVWMVIVLGSALSPAGLPQVTTLVIGRLLIVAFILAVGWGALNALALASDVYVQRFRMDTPDNLLARKHVTQVRILRRASETLIAVITASAALMTFPQVREYGVSLFASAGAAGLVVGLAARPLLSNLIAGVQLAITQPIRLEDAVVVEGEWGWIETIASTHVVVRIWDLRRLVLPLTYFIERPFQNWTKQNADLLGSVLLHVDYTVQIEELRRKLTEIVTSTPLWDGKVVVLQVVDALPTTIQLRALVSARNSGQAWDLRCYVREKMIEFLQRNHPHALPRQRVDLEGELKAADRSQIVRATD
jgi:small-conductance mechanosensitive channel